MRAVGWSREALDDIKEQVVFIARDRRTAALNVADRIRDAGEALGKHAVGRPGRLAGTYEKSVSRLPYIIVYALGANQDQEIIIILRVIHMARDWPAEGKPNDKR